MSNFPEGEYQAKASSACVTRNRFNVDCVALEFVITDGALAGRTVSQEYELSDARYQQTVDMLVLLGWQKRGLAKELLAEQCIKPVTIVVRHYESRRLDRNGKPYVNMAVDVKPPKIAVQGNELSALEQRLRERGVMEGDAPAPAPRRTSPAAEDDIPF